MEQGSQRLSDDEQLMLEACRQFEEATGIPFGKWVPDYLGRWRWIKPEELVTLARVARDVNRASEVLAALRRNLDTLGKQVAGAQAALDGLATSDGTEGQEATR